MSEWSVCQSVCHAYFSNARKRVFSTIEAARDCAWEVMKGAGKGVTREGAIRDGASEEITRGTHLTAVYPALFYEANTICSRFLKW